MHLLTLSEAFGYRVAIEIEDGTEAYSDVERGDRRGMTKSKRTLPYGSISVF